MKYIIGSEITIAAALLSHIIYKIDGYNFYIAFISGGISMLIYSFIIDYKNQNKQIKEKRDVKKQ